MGRQIRASIRDTSIKGIINRFEGRLSSQLWDDFGWNVGVFLHCVRRQPPSGLNKGIGSKPN